MHHNEILYPHSFSFIPERWLGNPKAAPPFEHHALKHYLTSFGRGTRDCIGMNLAHAEIVIVLASLFRRFELTLYETTYERDVQVVRDVIAPDVSKESQGIRVLIKDLAKEKTDN